MFLKQVELYGFKSFSSKTLLKFGEGVTAIVGPNGCGKTNIQDAIKWVLGEQNPRQLRGSEMQDVIFNGTADVPSLGFAEVSLTLDNSTNFFSLQYDEVVITRRLYRSGESEYLINKVPVRLKDIIVLIAGTGMGTSSYAIIEQGKMDQVLAAKPGERRDIFEEASGITKYKVKEKEALRKLDQSEENLVRVRDILLEVKRQVSSIERQVTKAQKYQQLYEQLKKLEIGLGALDYRQFNQRKLQAERKKSELEAKLQQLSQERIRYSEKTVSLRDELAGRRQVLEEKEKEWAQLEASSRLSRDRVAMEKETQKEWQSQREWLSGELAAAAQRIEQLNGQIQQGEQDQETIQREQKTKEELLLLLEKEIQALLDSIREEEQSVSRGQSRLADLTRRQADLNNELLEAVHQRQNLAGQQSRLSKQLEEVSRELALLEEEKTKLLQSEQEYHVQLDELQKSETWISEKLSVFRAAYQQTTEQFHQKENLQSAMVTKIQFLEDLRARYEGFSEGVRYLLAGEKPLSEGVFDCVANLIEVEAGYELAVEAALGEDLQTVLADKTQTAFQAMETAAGFGKGKVTLLSLEWIPYSTCGSARENSAKGKPLLQFVRCGERYRPAIEYLLKDVFVLEGFNSSDLGDIELSSSRFVTADGRLMGNGFISGGRGRTQETTLIGRESRVRQLKNEQQEMAQQIETLKNRLDQAKETISGLEAEQAETHQKNQELERDLTQRQAGVAELGRRTQSLISQKTVLEKEVAQLVSERQMLEKKERKLNDLAALAQAAHQEEHQQLEDLKQLVLTREQERENRQISLTEISTELNALTREAEKQKRTVEFLRQTLINEEESQAGRQTSLGELKKRIQQSQSAVLELEQQAQIWEKQRENFQKELNLLKSRQTELETELRNDETEERVLQEKRQQFQETTHLAQMETKEMDVKIEHLLLRLRDSYQVETSVLAEAELECHVEQAQTELQQLRQKVQQMGPVNVAALEEHKELTERLQFLTTQEQDLVSSKESFTSAIQKIRRTTRTLFRETFEKIQTHFHHYFTKLFGGGDAQLVLVDQEEVLESGIEILVRPSGKKLQNISLLSGGEKALTATALLFALFKTKPSPFCILDEIDAPLDEANIDRFCDALKEFTQQSQFLIITHNKKTMTIADVLYGVTMERPGISQIISVKMTKPTDTAPLEEAESALV